jgi:hypothetical protein
MIQRSSIASINSRNSRKLTDFEEKKHFATMDQKDNKANIVANGRASFGGKNRGSFFK